MLFATAILSFVLVVQLGGDVLAQDRGSKKYWIFFRDKGAEWSSVKSFQKGSSAYQAAKSNLSDKALARRAKVLPPDELIDFTDLPVSQEYITTIEQHGIKPIVASRWLNAISAFLDQRQARELASLSFVERVVPVAIYHRRDTIEDSPAALLPKEQGTVSLDYGPSWTQLNLMQVPRLHEIGITGEGILVGMLDTGFRWKWHEALRNIKVIAEHDFINNRDTTANGTLEEERAGQDAHGTATLSVIGGFMPGKLIGAAYGASFILGKTEWVSTETRIEEDNWVAGIEWMESKGVDVVSSSLGYDIFDDGTGYTHAHGDFNGRTAVTTRVAVMAARKGVAVVTAMGNERNGDGIVGTMITPADADSIMSVGAVGADTSLASFSSTGPTDDGRIKPDVVAMGSNVYVALPPGPSSYAYSNGTSFSTPLTASVAVLVLSARPELTPIQVRDAMRNSAVHFKDKLLPDRTATYPNNFYGWGLVNAYAALYHGVMPTAYLLFQNYPNPFNPSTTISYDLPEQSNVTLRVFDVLGREVKTLVEGEQQAGRYDVPFVAGNLSSGVYFYQLRANDFRETKRMIIVR